MHIEPGVVTGAKIALSYLTAAGAGGVALAHAARSAREYGTPSVALRSVVATAAVFSFFQLLPHHPVGVSEVHLILGSTLFLILGAGPAAIGLATGLLLQGLFFAPTDLPQYGMNVTTLLVPLFAVKALADRIIAPGTAYVDLRYSQALALSVAFQGGVVGWVTFWAVYGHGLTLANISAIAAFGGAYMLVVLVEPLADLAVLAAAKRMRGLTGTGLFAPRVHHAAA